MNPMTRPLSPEQQLKIHNFSLQILAETGIRFNSKPALTLFAKHGAEIRNNTVFFNEKIIKNALSSVPSSFTWHARNEQRSIPMGGDHHHMGPGYGAPFILEKEGTMRNANMDDYDNFCKLTHTSPHLDFLGSIMVQPADLSATTGHLKMLYSNFTLSDKPTMGSTASPRAARDSLNMAKIIFNTLNRPVVMGLINSLAPLQFAHEMTDALMIYAENGQPVIIHSGAMMGSTSPITGAGTQVMQNAMNLAGICLAQLVHPGTPVVYGAGGTPLDMKTGGYTTGSPELIQNIAVHAQMGRYYNIPTRAGGAFTDSLAPDYQAGAESSLILGAAATCGVNMSLHCCGILGAYIAMGYEKFMADEELCGVVKKMVAPVDYSDEAFAIDLIKEIGPGGQYLSHMHTMKRCRTAFFQNKLFNKSNHDRWFKNGKKWAHEMASDAVTHRLESYTKPPMDSNIENALKQYIELAHNSDHFGDE